MPIMTASAAGTVEHRVFGRFSFLTTRLPEELGREGQARFEKLWELARRQSDGK